MKKNGFTLVEILAVLVLIAAIAIISVPSIINYINQDKSKISELTEQLIFTGADLFIDNNKSLFPKVVGNEYCIILSNIVDSNLLEAPIIDSVSGEEVSLDTFIKVSYKYNNELDTNKFHYEMVDNCTPNIVNKTF